MKSKKLADFGDMVLSFGFRAEEVSEEQIEKSWQHILENIRNGESASRSQVANPSELYSSNDQE